MSSSVTSPPTSVSAPTTGATPKLPVVASTAPVAPPPPVSIAAGVNAQAGVKVPKGVSTGNTDDLITNEFHGMIYGETSSWKSVTGASFGGPQKTLIVLTREKEQLIPLRGEGYRYLQVDNADGLLWTMQFPEKAADHAGFPEWKDTEGRVLMIDDMTAGADMLIDSNSTNDQGKEIKFTPLIYKGAKGDLKEVIASLKRKEMHLILIALARVAKNTITNEETISPNLPPSMIDMLTADLEYVFYLRKSNHKMLCDESTLTYQKLDEQNKMQSYKRTIFAKNKIPKNLKGQNPPIIKLEEEPDLLALWKRIREAKVR